MNSCCAGAHRPSSLQRAKETINSRFSKLHEASDKAVGWCLHLTDIESKSGIALRSGVALVYFMFAAGSLMIWDSVHNRLHVLFWLGDWPEASLLLTMVALSMSFFVLTRIRITRYFRFQEQREDPDEGQLLWRRSYYKNAATHGRIRGTVCCSVILSLASAILGGFVLVKCLGISDKLLDICGSAQLPQSRELDEQSAHLAQFQKKCLGNATVTANFSFIKNVKSVTECPDFDKEFPPWPGGAGYFLRLETFEGCTGFCKEAEPLLIEDRATQIQKHLPCAKVASQHARYITLLVAIPSIALGIITAVFNFLLFVYTDL